MVEELTKETIKDKINENNNKPIIICFYRNYKYYEKFESVFEKISNDFEMFDFAKYNINKDKNLAKKLEIKDVPCTIAFWVGKEVERIIGALPEEKMKDRMKKILCRLC